MTRAVELHERAAELGVKEAHFDLGCLYAKGTDVEKDTAKAFRHYEAAAMCGQVEARHTLGYLEYDAGNYDLALQHFLISAKLGYEKSLNKVKISFTKGLATKANYAAALRGYQNANDEMLMMKCQALVETKLNRWGLTLRKCKVAKVADSVPLSKQFDASLFKCARHDVGGRWVVRQGLSTRQNMHETQGVDKYNDMTLFFRTF